MLHMIYEFVPAEFDQNANVTVEGSLAPKIVDEIIECLFETCEMDIPGWQKKLLRPPVDSATLQLKKKWEQNN